MAPVAAVAVVGSLVGACAPTEPSVDLPQAWESIDGSGSVIELSPDGSGQLTEVPVMPAGGGCDRDDAVLFSGAVSWKGDGEFSYLIEADRVELVLWVDVGPMRQADWQSVSLAFCGRETPWDMVLDYGAS